jgi:galactose mutarotase-like enzyme
MTSRQQLALRSDELEVVILPEFGGRIHRIRAFGEDLLRTPDDPATHGTEPFFWGAYVMAPWCNRAAPGPVDLAGRVTNLAPNFPDGTAIHGLVSSAPWARRGEAEVVVRLDAGAAWPWPFEVEQSARLGEGTLDMEYRLVNLDAEALMPGGLGLHPWFLRPIEVQVPAERAYATNSGSPREPTPVAGEDDLRALASPADGLDATWTALARPRIELRWPGSGIRATLDVQTDAGGVLVALASPPGLDAIAVEPQTHGPDPLRRLAAGEPDPPALLAPGASMSLTVRISVARDGDRP